MARTAEDHRQWAQKWAELREKTEAEMRKRIDEASDDVLRFVEDYVSEAAEPRWPPEDILWYVGEYGVLEAVFYHYWVDWWSYLRNRWSFLARPRREISEEERDEMYSIMNRFFVQLDQELHRRESSRAAEKEEAFRIERGGAKKTWRSGRGELFTAGLVRLNVDQAVQKEDEKLPVLSVDELEEVRVALENGIKRVEQAKEERRLVAVE